MKQQVTILDFYNNTSLRKFSIIIYYYFSFIIEIVHKYIHKHTQKKYKKEK